MKIAVINPTNAVPKRVLQLSLLLNETFSVEHVCWERFERGNIKNAIFIRSGSYVIFLFKLIRLLLEKRYRFFLFDDLRLLPGLAIFGKLTGSFLIYNRQEIPTIVAAQKIFRLIPLPYRIVRFMVELFETFFVRGVDIILTVPVKGRELNRLAGWKKQVLMISNVPDKENAEIQRPKVTVDNCPFKMIYSGAVAEENGLKLYLKLIQALSDEGYQVKLILIGRLWNLPRHELDAIIAENCNGMVEYMEWIPYDELVHLLATVDVGLALTDPNFEKYKYLGEGASRKIFTYMAAGIPVIAGGAFGAVVEEEGAGLYIDYEDFNGLLNASRYILVNRDIAWSMGNRGRLAILEKYNYDLEKAKILKCFQNTW